MSFAIKLLLSLVTGQQRGRWISPFCSVALLYTLYINILSLPGFLTEVDTPIFFFLEDRVFVNVHVIVHIERSRGVDNTDGIQ